MSIPHNLLLLRLWCLVFVSSVLTRSRGGARSHPGAPHVTKKPFVTIFQLFDLSIHFIVPLMQLVWSMIKTFCSQERCFRWLWRKETIQRGRLKERKMLWKRLAEGLRTIWSMWSLGKGSLMTWWTWRRLTIIGIILTILSSLSLWLGSMESSAQTCFQATDAWTWSKWGFIYLYYLVLQQVRGGNNVLATKWGKLEFTIQTICQLMDGMFFTRLQYFVPYCFPPNFYFKSYT